MSPAVGNPVNQSDQNAAANQIADRDGHEVAEKLSYGDGVSDDHAERDEIHIGDAVLETKRDKRRDWKNDESHNQFFKITAFPGPQPAA